MLARRFLRLHLHRNTVAEWLRRRSGVWRLDKASLNHYLETALRVQFPEFDVISDLTNSALAPAEIGNISSVDKAQQQQSPTLANSLKSDDLSHFRKISVHAMLQLSKLARGSWSTSSFLSQSGSRSRISIAGISDITASFRSMSIHSGNASGKRALSPQVASTTNSLWG